MLKLNEDLKNGVLRRAYLLYGEESYLRRQYRDRLLAALADPEDEMNVSRFEGKEADPKEIIDLAETLPFFAERRVILVENSGWFKGGKKSADTNPGAAAELAAYLPQLPGTSVLIFVEEEADRRGRLFKAIREFGGDARFSVQKEDVLRRWIVQTLRGEKKSIGGDALALFLDCTGTSMETIDRELEKLICYTMGRDVISAQDVREICSGQTEDRIFKMIDAIAEKKEQQAFALYADLLALRVAPIKILVLIQRQFRILMETSDLTEKGYSRGTIAQMTGVRDFAVSRNQAQASGFGTERLTGILRLCNQTDEEIKSGLIDAQLGCELLIVSCMRPHG